MRRTQIGEEWLFRALSRPRKAGPGPQAPRPAPTGRASAPLDARRRAGQAAAARGTSARGRRRCDIPRPSRAHALLHRPPPKKSANSRPAPQTTGLSRPGRPGLSVGQGTGTRAAPLGAQSRSLPLLTYCAYGATRTRIHSKTGDRRGLLLDATPPPLLHPASGHSHSWLNQLKRKKEHRHQARTPSIETYL